MSNTEDIENQVAGLSITADEDIQREDVATQTEASSQDNDQQAGDDGYEAEADTKGDDVIDDAEEEEEAHVPATKVQWDSLLQLITMRVDEAMEAAAAIDGQGENWSAEEHNRHYRAAFEAMRDEVAKRDDIPEAIVSAPGVHLLRLVFCPARLSGRCPCCLDGGYSLPFAVVGVSNDDEFPEVGITKDILIQGLRDGLHPEPKPKPKLEEGGEKVEFVDPKEGSEQVVEADGGDEDSDDDDDDDGLIDADKVTLLNFCWMNDHTGLVDDTLYVYYSTPDDDSSSTRSVSAREEEEQGEPGGDGEEKEESSTKEE